jgi:hypothetical protein
LCFVHFGFQRFLNPPRTKKKKLKNDNGVAGCLSFGATSRAPTFSTSYFLEYQTHQAWPTRVL